MGVGAGRGMRRGRFLLTRRGIARVIGFERGFGRLREIEIGDATATRTERGTTTVYPRSTTPPALLYPRTDSTPYYFPSVILPTHSQTHSQRASHFVRWFPCCSYGAAHERVDCWKAQNSSRR